MAVDGIYDAEDEKLDAHEKRLKERLAGIDALEKEIARKEKALKTRESAKKQIVLRLAPSLWNEIAAWAEEDFRSINGQIEYLLSECVRRRNMKNADNADKNKK